MDKSIEARLLKLLKASSSGQQVEELAAKLCLTRHTVAKYLEILLAEGKICFKKVGRAKLWTDMSTTTHIRLLNLEDLKSILLIEEKIEQARNTQAQARQENFKEAALYHLEHGDPLMNLGAEIDGRLVGFIFAETRLWEFGRGEKTGWIKVLGVDPEYQGRGIGRKLGETLLGHFKRKNIEKVRTLVDWFEGDLISYFKSLGFDFLNMIPLEKELGQ